MTKIVLTVIPKPEPDTRLVLTLAQGGLKGDGAIDLACGGCQEVLAAGLPDARLAKLRAAVVDRLLRAGGAAVTGGKKELVLKCPSCGAYNEVPSSA